MKLSIIAPIYNESAILLELHRRLSLVARQLTGDAYEIIFVNDGSRDSSSEVIKSIAERDAHIKYILFARNFGHQIAVTAGLDKCQGDAVVIIDGDLQDPPELIPELYQKYQEGFKIVYAQRNSRAGETIFKKVTAKIFYRLLAKLTRFHIPVDTGDFRLIDKAVVNVLRNMPEPHKYLRGQIAWTGFSQCPVLYDRHERVAGTTGYTFSKMMNFALDGITGFSDVPLRLATWLGFAVSGCAFLVILYAIFSHFFLERTITGWTSMIISSMFIGGIQLLCLGIMGEYISRMYRGVQNRPLYIIGDTNMNADKTV